MIRIWVHKWNMLLVEQPVPFWRENVYLSYASLTIGAGSQVYLPFQAGTLSRMNIKIRKSFSLNRRFEKLQCQRLNSEFKIELYKPYKSYKPPSPVCVTFHY